MGLGPVRLVAFSPSVAARLFGSGRRASTGTGSGPMLAFRLLKSVAIA